jgi:hypothetical protein
MAVYSDARVALILSASHHPKCGGARNALFAVIGNPAERDDGVLQLQR